MLNSPKNKTQIEALQPWLKSYFNRLTSSERKKLEQHLEKIDLPLLKQSLDLVRSNNLKGDKTFSPLPPLNQIDDETCAQEGRSLIEKGQVACLVVAGGMGTRLNYQGPKGLYPLDEKKTTLFELLSKRVRGASEVFGTPLSIAIMTSEANHEAITHYFEEKDYFGLHPYQVDFFKQGELPFIDKEGRLLLQKEDQISFGPNGNGLALHALYESGIWDKWEQKGVTQVNFILIDNPLADPFDLSLSGFHRMSGAECVVKVIEREDPEEKVGVLAATSGGVEVVEYSEAGEEMMEKRDEANKLAYPYANISLFSFSMPFIKKIASLSPSVFPLHKALKKAKGPLGESLNAWKFEYFIFDVLPFASKVDLHLARRSECFAPLKDQKSLVGVIGALKSFQASEIERVTGAKPSQQEHPFDPRYYYLSNNSLKKAPHG